MTELTPNKATQGQVFAFGLAIVACLIVVAMTITSHKPPRLATSAIIAAITCRTAGPLVPQLRKAMTGIGIALIALAIFAAIKGM